MTDAANSGAAEATNWTPWLHDDLLSTTPGAVNGNMLSYTSQAMFFTTDKAMGARLHLALLKCEVAAGVFTRVPGQLVNTQIDDYLSLGASLFAADILASLKKCWGFLDVTSPVLPSWNWKQQFYRFPGFVAHLNYRAGKKPNPFLRFAWALSVWLCANKSYDMQDTWMQTHLMVLVYEESLHSSWLCDKAGAFWRSKAPHSMKEIVLSYLSGGGAGVDWKTHPLYVLWED